MSYFVREVYYFLGELSSESVNSTQKRHNTSRTNQKNAASSVCPILALICGTRVFGAMNEKPVRDKPSIRLGWEQRQMVAKAGQFIAVLAAGSEIFLKLTPMLSCSVDDAIDANDGFWLARVFNEDVWGHEDCFDAEWLEFEGTRADGNEHVSFTLAIFACKSTTVRSISAGV
jgi:hypothetical protein